MFLFFIIDFFSLFLFDLFFWISFTLPLLLFTHCYTFLNYRTFLISCLLSLWFSYVLFFSSIVYIYFFLWYLYYTINFPSPHCFIFHFLSSSHSSSSLILPVLSSFLLTFTSLKFLSTSFSLHYTLSFRYFPLHSVFSLRLSFPLTLYSLSLSSPLPSLLPPFSPHPLLPPPSPSLLLALKLLQRRINLSHF